MEEAERWGEVELQPIPRRLFGFALTYNADLRRFVTRAQGLPAPDLIAAAIQSLAVSSVYGLLHALGPATLKTSRSPRSTRRSC